MKWYLLTLFLVCGFSCQDKKAQETSGKESISKKSYQFIKCHTMPGVSFRGMSLTEEVVWLSGSGGYILKSTDKEKTGRLIEYKMKQKANYGILSLLTASQLYHPISDHRDISIEQKTVAKIGK